MLDRSDLSVLFVCTHNSARSIIAEAILAAKAAGVRAYSAGSAPKSAPHPLAIELLRSFGHDVSRLRSKSWNEFAGARAPKVDYVIAVCDRAAGEPCPAWPGTPIVANWAIADPSAEAGGAVSRRIAFVRAYRQLEQRINAFLNDELGSPEDADPARRAYIQGRLDLVGEMMHAPTDDDLRWPGGVH